MSSASVLALSVFAVAAAASDLRTRRIPNGLLVTALGVAVLVNSWLQGWSGLSYGLTGFGIGLALMLPGWLLGFTGGGDAKLFATMGAFLGPHSVFYAFALSVFTGALFGIAHALYHWARQGAESPVARYGVMFTELMATGKPRYIRPNENEALGRRFPLAPAIATGSIGAALWF